MGEGVGIFSGTLEPRFNKPLYNKVLGITNAAKVTVKCMEQNLYITNLDIAKSLL